MSRPTDAQLRKFDDDFDSSFEDVAAQSRGAFLRAFPVGRLQRLTLDDYVIGKGTPTFCAYVEAKTKPWANILGATAIKFGVYFGKTKSDATMRYRFLTRFKTKEDAFTTVKTNLLELIETGRSQRFPDVDDNPLSQMFKAKILSLYFPDKYLNVCSKDHIEALASEFDISDNAFVSEQQHLLLEAKLHNGITRDWSNPKFMTFLYNTYIRSPGDRMHLKKFRKRKYPKIDVDEMLENRKKIGEMSEAFALKWEKERLFGAGRKNLIKLIEDCRDTPACGYDFLSHTAPDQARFIEVKSAGRNRAGAGYRFFLSETQHEISLRAEVEDRYYFYLVFYDKEGNPSDLKAWKAAELYAISELGPNGYVVAFDWENTE
jgi:Domain of unknown function (DUF3883)